MIASTEKHLTKREVAERLDLSIKTVERLVNRGELFMFSATASRGSKRITESSVAAFELRRMARNA